MTLHLQPEGSSDQLLFAMLPQPDQLAEVIDLRETTRPDVDLVVYADPLLQPFGLYENCLSNQVTAAASQIITARNNLIDTSSAGLEVVTTLQQSIGVSADSRATRRLKGSYYFDPADQITEAVTLLVSDLDTTERSAAIYNLLRPHFNGALGNEATTLLVTAIEGLIQYQQIAHQQSLNVVESMQQAAIDNIPYQYHVLKMMALTAEAARQEDPDRVGTATIFAGMFITAGLVKREDSLPEQLATQLEAGVYDRLIARDLLQFAVNHPENKDPHIQKAAEFVRFLADCVPEIGDNQQLIARLVNAKPSWQSEPRAVFQEARSRFAAQVARSIALAKTFVDDEGFAPQSESPQADFANGINNFKQLLAKKPLPLGSIISKHETVLANVAAKRARHASAQQLPQAQADSNPEHQDVPPPPTFRLAHVNMRGSVADRGSDVFKEMVADYLASHKGAPNLEDDVQAILDYMSHFDFSKGEIRGLKKLKDGTAYYGDLGRHDTYEFKPSDSTLKLKCRRTSRSIRVNCILLPDNTIGITAFGDRDKLTTTLRRSGIGATGGK